MKRIRIVTVTCWAITAIALIGLAVWFLTGSLFGYHTDGWLSGMASGLNWEILTGPYEIVGEYSIPASGLDSLYVDWTAGEVTVRPWDGEDIHISEYAQRDLQDDEILYYNISDGLLTIKYCETNSIFRNMPIKRIYVLIPHELSVGMARFTVDTSSAAIDVSNISTPAFKADAVSGAVRLSNISAQVFNASTTSGSLTISSVNADSIKLDSVSGIINAQNAIAVTFDSSTTSGSQTLSGLFERSDLDSISGRITFDSSAMASVVRADTTSGGIDISGFIESAEINSISGGVSVRSGIVPSSLSVGTTSGGITVAVPNEGAISVSYSSISGKLSSDIPIITQGSGAQFNLSTTSGNAKIQALG